MESVRETVEKARPDIMVCSIFSLSGLISFSFPILPIILILFPQECAGKPLSPSPDYC
jgi:hypothetical protein